MSKKFFTGALIGAAAAVLIARFLKTEKGKKIVEDVKDGAKKVVEDLKKNMKPENS